MSEWNEQQEDNLPETDFQAETPLTEFGESEPVSDDTENMTADRENAETSEEPTTDCRFCDAPEDTAEPERLHDDFGFRMQPPPPPPKKSGWKAVLVAATVVLLAGLAVVEGVLLLNRSTDTVTETDTQSVKTNIIEVESKTDDSRMSYESDTDTSSATETESAGEGKTDAENIEVIRACTPVDNDLTELAARCMTSMVSINVVSTQTVSGSSFLGFGQGITQTVTSAGSGVIFAKSETKLYIMTNEHVVDGGEQIGVTFCDQSQYYVTVRGEDAEADIAVLEIPLSELLDSTREAISVATLGDSDTLKIGATAIAIGNALGEGQSVTAGIISILNREVQFSDDPYTRYLIQTDAAINPGNSGGALFNCHGEVIGINEGGSTSADNIGYAIPINDALDAAYEILSRVTYSETERGYLGIRGLDVSSAFRYYQQYGIPEGVYVQSVDEGLPADLAGIRAGDIITAVGGKVTTSQTELGKQLAYYTSGDSVEITVYRQSKNGTYEEMTLTATLISRVEAGVES